MNPDAPGPCHQAMSSGKSADSGPIVISAISNRFGE